MASRPNIPNYYQVLDVPNNASFESIKHAYRSKALEYHPDRGGSHEQMILINEAWQILSNPTSRKTFNDLLAQTSNSAIQRGMETEVKKARSRSTNYHRNWNTFEDWLNHISEDFTEANYDEIQSPIGAWSLPIIKGSYSGWFCIFIGGVAGYYFKAFLLSQGRMSLTAFCCFIGLWVGYYAHVVIRIGFVEKTRPI